MMNIKNLIGENIGVKNLIAIKLFIKIHFPKEC